MPRILYKSKNFIVIEKPAGIPSQKDHSGDEDAMTLTSKQLLSCCEREELFLVHRLDRVVGGLLVFARNKKSCSEISKLLTSECFTKGYYAIVHGNAKGGILTDYIFKDSAKNKAFVKTNQSKGAKYAELSYIPIFSKEDKTLVKIELKTGRFHQIRAQFASRGMPLVGDGKYGSQDNMAHFPSLFAGMLKFNCMGETVDISIFPDMSLYPWCLFKENIEESGK